MSQTSAPQRFASVAASVSAVGRPTQERELALELSLKIRRRQNVRDAVLEPRDRGHQRLGHVAAAERAEASVLVRQTALEQRCEQRSRSFASV